MIFKWHNTSSLYWSFFFFCKLGLVSYKTETWTVKIHNTAQGDMEIPSEKSTLVRGGGGVELSY